MEYNWEKRDIKISNMDIEWANVSMSRNNLSPSQLFRNYFEKEIIDEVNTQLRLQFNFGEKNVLENSPDCQSTIVSKSMSRNRLEHILSNIHCCDNNNLNKSDKFSNIRPLFDKLNSRFLHIAPMEPFHCVDEAMVPYFGIHGCKQFIRGKPLRYGYKLWVGATASGYIVWYEPYQGAKSAIKHCYKNLALGPSVVLESIGILQTKCKLSYSIYCDYFFNTLPLINTLTEKGVKCTGTIRENCLGNCHLVSDADLKKHRGSYDFRVTDDNSIVTEKWSDNNMVHMASNDYGIFPLHQVSRYSHKGRRRIQQQTIKNYNIYMERVDRSDQNISLYRIRGKKWYFPIIVPHLINAAEQNAWQFHRKQGGKLDHLAFRRNVALMLIETNKENRGLNLCKRLRAWARQTGSGP
ncbi:hypothetical protein YQE_08906, partial [Dendroctonus ponderosae]